MKCTCNAKRHYNKEHNLYWCSNCLMLFKRKQYNKTIARAFAMLVLISISFTALRAHAPIVGMEYRMSMAPKNTDIDLTDSAIAAELTKNECVLVNVAVTQSRIETGNYTSYVCRANRNLFGIKFHKCKYVSGEANSHATYNSYKDCIKCYVEVQNRYLKSIDGKYAEAGNYIEVIKSYK